MWRDSLLRRYVALGLSLSFSLQVSGCTSWQAQTRPPTEVLTTKSYTSVRVTRLDGTRALVYNPRVVNDTLVGFPLPETEKFRGDPVSIPATEIRYLEVNKTDAGKTILLVAGVGLVLVLIAAAASAASDLGGGGQDTMPISCPMLYSWDGAGWRLDSGTFSGAVMPALERTDVDNLVYARPEQDRLRLRVANEQGETDYIDALSLVAVDHAQGVDVLPDGIGSGIHVVSDPISPVLARDDAGRNLTERIGTADGLVWESVIRLRDSSRVQDRRDGIELAFTRPAGADSALLVFEGRNSQWAAFLLYRLVHAWGGGSEDWYLPETSAEAAARVAPVVAEGGPITILVRVNGDWQPRGQIREIGPEVAKRVAVPLDLTGVGGDRVEIRLESVPNFWQIDYLALAAKADDRVQVQDVPLASAIRQDGADVRSALVEVDGSRLVLERGDRTEITAVTPPVPSGLVRSYLVRTTGWYRIHGGVKVAADTALLRAVAGPDGPAVVAVQLANDALARLH